MMNPYVANFRDVGVSINILAGKSLMKEGVLLRGGKVEAIPSIETIQSPKSIVNLRKGDDPFFDGVFSIYSPAPNSVEVYDITQGRNKKWVAETLQKILEVDNPFPCYIHCAAGKDRTGVIIIAILSALGLDHTLIRDEYMLSTGLLQPKLIPETIELLSDMRIYRKVDRRKLQNNLLISTI